MRIGALETLEPRVLLNADVDIHARPPVPFVYGYGASTPPAAVSAGPESTIEADPRLFSPEGEIGWEDDRSAVAAPTPDVPGAFMGPVPPAVSGRTEASRNLGSPAGIYLYDDQGNTRSSDDPEWNTLFAGATGPAQSGESSDSPPSIEEFPTGPPSPEELNAFPRVPWTRNYSYAGAIEADAVSVAFRIPVGPTTQMLKLDVRAGVDGQIIIPRIDQLYLMGARGEMLAGISGVKFMASGSEQLLFVSIHGAPIGGQLFMRLVRGEDSTSFYGDDGSTSSDAPPSVQIPDSWGTANYEISILRSDVVSNSGGNGVPSSSGPTYITTLPTETADSTLISSPPSSSWTTSSNPDGTVEARGGEAAQSDDKDGVKLTDLEDEAPAVYLGPLVARTAAPLGPVLATFAGDPAPPTARADHSSRGVLDALGSDLDLDLLLNLRGRRSANLSADRGDAGATSAELRGSGGAPILIANVQPTDAQSEAAALAASLHREAEQEELLTEAADASRRDRGVEVARAGLATRAVGFLIGLGLASGPLYPDLVSLARRKLLRGPRPLRRKTAKRGGTGG